jgi:diphosphomevalonate decarboxylase
VKYWGKKPAGRNLPATPSLAVTLGGLSTLTRVRLAEGSEDRVEVGGAIQPAERFAPFFDELRRRLGTKVRFAASSRNDFPTGAGLASSSSGFAALTLACARAAALAGELRRPAAASDPGILSEIARIGSASAARAVHGGFTILPAGAPRAERILGPEHWPELRVVAALASKAPKALSSRGAMESTRLTSPYYAAWVRDAARLFPEALEALRDRDLPRLGAVALLSYSRMHASALAADPPALYWNPNSVALVAACAALRARGIGAWETMDAGPQVKVLCLAPDLAAVEAGLRGAVPGLELIVARPGAGPDLAVEAETAEDAAEDGSGDAGPDARRAAAPGGRRNGAGADPGKAR